MSHELSLDDFFDMLGRYGADIGNWPLSPEQLQSVASFLARSSAAREAVEEMRSIEDDLRGDMPRAPIGLADRVLTAAGVPRRAGHPIFAVPRPRHPVLN